MKFRVKRTGPLPLSPPTLVFFFLLTIPRRSFCCSFSLFPRLWFHNYVAFVLSLTVLHLSLFGASGGLCFVIEAFPGFLHLILALSFSYPRHWKSFAITKTLLYNFDLLRPQFYIVKPGFTGGNLIFLISAQKQILWVLVRTASPRRF